jgi:hypothetical protein
MEWRITQLLEELQEAEKKLSVEGSSKGRKVGVKCKNKEMCSSSSETELVESEGEVPTAFGPHPKDDKEDFVGVRFVENGSLLFG